MVSQHLANIAQHAYMVHNIQERVAFHPTSRHLLLCHPSARGGASSYFHRGRSKRRRLQIIWGGTGFFATHCSSRPWSGRKGRAGMQGSSPASCSLLCTPPRSPLVSHGLSRQLVVFCLGRGGGSYSGSPGRQRVLQLGSRAFSVGAALRHRPLPAALPPDRL